MIYYGANNNPIYYGANEATIYYGSELIYPTTISGLSISPDSISFSKTGGSKTIRVACESDWELFIDSSVDWLTASVTGGTSGRSQVTLTALANSGTSALTTVISAMTTDSAYTATCQVTLLYRPIPANNSILAKYNLTATGNTQILSTYYNSAYNLTGMSVDGGSVENISKTYTFNTTGEHQVVFYYTGTSLTGRHFENITALTECYVGEGVTTFGSDTFAGAVNLETLGLPSTLTYSSNSLMAAFAKCDKLNDMYGECVSDNMVFLNNVGMAAAGSGNKVIPEGVTTCQGYFFYLLSGVTSVSFPSTFNSLSWGMFAYWDYNNSPIDTLYFNSTTAPTLTDTKQSGNRNVKESGIFHYPTGSDYSTIQSALGSNWTGIADL